MADTIYVGEVVGANPLTKAYQVRVVSVGIRDAILIENGVTTTLDPDTFVACHYSTEVGWLIVGTIPIPVRPSKAADSTQLDDYIAAEVARLFSHSDGDDRESLVKYRPSHEEPDLLGEVSLRNRLTRSFVKLISDGSLVGYVSNILFAFFSATKDALVVRCSRLIFQGSGLGVNHGLPDPGASVTPNPTPPKISTDINYAYDPDRVTDIDIAVDLGAIDKNKEPQPTYAVSDYINLATDIGRPTGETPEPSSSLTRGVRMLLRKLGLLEIDLWKNELRLSSLSGTPPAQARQFRMNDDEFAIEWNQHIFAMDANGFSVRDAVGNFMLFKAGEFFLKASKIGLCGPVSLWDYVTEGAQFLRTNGYPDPDRQALLWDSTGTSGPGLYFKQDVYFGDEGQPAILKGLFDEHYSLVWDALATHFHSTSSPGSPTGPMTAPALDTLNGLTLNSTVITDLWFSLMTVPG